MGCDIHLRVERKTGAGWESVVAPEKHRSEWDDHDPATWEWGQAGNRIYSLFSFLADVRNYCRRGQGKDVYRVEFPVCAPRGLPDDATDESRKWAADGDIHSVTWFNPKWLLAHPGWDQPVGDIAGRPSVRDYSSGFLAFLGEVADLGETRVIIGFDN